MLCSNYSTSTLSTDRKLIHHGIIHFTLIPYQLEQVKYYEIASNIANGARHHTLFFPGAVMTFDRFAREKLFLVSFPYHHHISILFYFECEPEGARDEMRNKLYARRENTIS